MLKQLRLTLLQAVLKGNVNVMAIDYTAETQDTHRPEKQGKDVILTSITFLTITT